MSSGVAVFSDMLVKTRKRRRRKERGPRSGSDIPDWSRPRRSDVRPATSGWLISNVIMAALGVIVDSLVAFWRNPTARQWVHWMFLLIALVGSVAKELQLVPQTYFSHSRNAVNVYMVKLSWAWTLLLLTPFVLLCNSCFSRSVYFLGRRLLSLAVATAIWYVCVSAFFYIEDVTGSCFQSVAMDVVNEEFTNKVACRRAGFHWHGYDISGHCFILTYSTLFIVEEMAPMALVKDTSLSALPRTVLKLLYIALNLIVCVWLWMFGCTCVYFHDLSHKLIGTAFGLLAWYLTYRVWYLKAVSPGLPPQRHHKEQKQHA